MKNKKLAKLLIEQEFIERDSNDNKITPEDLEIYNILLNELDKEKYYPDEITVADDVIKHINVEEEKKDLIKYNGIIILVVTIFFLITLIFCMSLNSSLLNNIFHFINQHQSNLIFIIIIFLFTLIINLFLRIIRVISLKKRHY